MSRPRSGKPTIRLIKTEVNENAPASWDSSDWAYFRDLHKIIDEVFLEAAKVYGWTWSQLASNAGLSYTTVAKLGDRITRWPRYQTIYKICQAVGWELSVEKKKSKKKAALKKVG